MYLYYSLSECKKNLQDLISAEADLEFEFNEKSEVYETKKRLMLSLLSPEQRRIVEDFIEVCINFDICIFCFIKYNKCLSNRFKTYILNSRLFSNELKLYTSKF